MSLENKRIVVTGAASGIGAQTAKELRAQGAEVIALDRNPVDAYVDEYIEADLSDPTAIENAVARIHGSVDGLCNIAGVPPTAGVELVLKVNVLGLQRLTELLVPQMNAGSSIVSVASLAGAGWPVAVEQIKRFQADANFENVKSVCQYLKVDDARSYFFAKEVLIAWTMQNRWTWRDKGIRINCVSPGPVETPILPDFMATLGERAEKDKEIMDRPGRPEDIAPVLVFLCSPQSDWIRGTNIPVDGGMFSHSLCEMHQL